MLGRSVNPVLPVDALDCNPASSDGKELAIDCELVNEVHAGLGPRMGDL